MRGRSLALALLLGLTLPAGHAVAQSSPFDMSGEKSSAPMVQPLEPEAPGPAYPPPLQLQPASAPTAAPGVPMMVPPLGSGGDAASGAAAPRNVAPGIQPAPPPIAVPATPALASQPAAPGAAASAPPAAASALRNRYIIPQPSLRFEGENDQRAWTIFLTAGEATSPAHLRVSYKNAIVAMPEASRLRISINGLVVLETPLASSDDFKSVAADVPAGVLQAGANLLRFEAIQRHRTDCSVQSTYELWTDIEPSGTMLSFDGDAAAMAPETLEDLPAVGYDATGRTTIRIVTPQSRQATAAPMLLKLAQSLSLYGQYPNPAVVVSDTMDAASAAGTLTVVVSPASDLATLIAQPPEAAARQPAVSFVSGTNAGSSALAVSGADWGQVQAAINAMAVRIDRPLEVVRTTLATSTWFAPDVHFFTGAESVSFAALGVPTQQFSGRRFRVVFGFGVPSDFYAEAYGEATIDLDAAYTPAVLPASHIDVYVNGQIAATTRIVNTSGGIFRHFPIKIPFRHFHPGVNQVAIEASLDTEADRVCGPGGSVAGPDRFALFDTSAFTLPAFARMGRRPNLAAFAGTGFPYNRQPLPSALVMPRTNAQTLAAASTLLARLAAQAGRIVPFDVVGLSALGDRPALFIGAASQMPADLLKHLEIADDIRSNWKPDAAYGARTPEANADGNVLLPADAERGNTDVLFDQWRDKLSDGGGWRGQISGFEDWLKRTFDISFAKLRLGPSGAAAFQPRGKASLLLAQGSGPGEQATWTLMTAPTDEQLLSAAQSLVAIGTWSQIGGQFSTYSASTGRVDNQAPAQVQFIVTQPLSAQNLRLVAANWLSSNITFYAIGLITMCVLLGIVTSGLLHRLGRPS